MTPRERTLSIVLVVLILLGGGGAAGYFLFYQPIREKNAASARLDQEIGDLKAKQDAAAKEAPRLAVAQKRSLPADKALAKREYAEMMSRLLTRAKVPPGFRIQEVPASDSSAQAGKKLPYERVAFKISFEKVDMWAVHDFLTAYYQLDLLHQITHFEVKSEASQNAAPGARRPTDRKDLVVAITTEAIILEGAETRRTLLPVSTAFGAAGGMAAYDAMILTPEAGRGLAPLPLVPVLATRTRDYSLIVQNDLFHGPLPPLPSMQFEKLADISSEPDQPIPPVRVRLTGDLGATGRVAIEAKTDGGKLLPTGSVKVDAATKTITVTPAKGELGSGKVTVIARTEEGKEARSSFSVAVKETEVKGSEEKKLPEISDSIKLIIASTRSDGTGGAIIRDNFNPLAYEIEVGVSGRVRVTKYFFAGMNKKKDKFYEPIDQLVISDEEVSNTRRTFKVVAIDSDGLIVADLKPETAKPETAKPAPPKGPPVPGKPPGPPRAEKQGPAEPLAVAAGAVAVVKHPPLVLYRWGVGKSLKALAEVPKDEAKKILQRSKEGGPVNAGAVAAGGN